MKKLFLRIIMFLSLLLLTSGLIFIYLEFYSVEDEVVGSSIDNNDIELTDLENDDIEELSEDIKESSEQLLTEESDAEETQEDVEEDDIDNFDSEENQDKEVIVERSLTLDNKIRDFDYDRINYYEDYIPIIRLNQLKDSLIGATITVTGEVISNQNSNDGYVLLIKDKDSLLKVEYLTQYSRLEIGDIVTLSGELKKESNEYIITTDRVYEVWQSYRETIRSLEDVSWNNDTSLGGLIVEKKVFPEGHIELEIQDSELKSLNVLIPNTLNPIANNYNVDDFVIVRFNKQDYHNNHITIQSLRDIEKLVNDENVEIMEFTEENLSTDNIGSYGVIESKIVSYHKFPDNTIYLVLKSNETYYHGTILQEIDGMSDEMSERLLTIEESASNNNIVSFFGMINQFDGEEELIIIDVFKIN